MATTKEPPPFGIYTPVVIFFHDDETIDFESTSQHVQRLLLAGVRGLVIHGSNGEATHMLPDERVDTIRHVKALIQEKDSKAVIIAGCSANSVREVLLNIGTACEAGADYALILPPNYWAAAMTKPVIKTFYLEVARKSALPIVIYNFPAVVSSIDLDSDLITELATSSSNIVGVKLTCGNVGKLQRISASTSNEKFVPLAGKSDFLLPALVAGSSGAIAALANVVPKVHVHVLQLYAAGDLAKAQDIQKSLALADWALAKYGISGVKTVCQKWFGYGTGMVRAPLPVVDVVGLSKDLELRLQCLIDMELSL
ncbi:hypothetical protein V501_00966 [Pseudogymnoascus sp. VKM F-4519 (FW-2642)]|nr:hypothetical protein V501_00966 [Pseudogymnoascus sp. VKM F-4519 (FW-2642)]